MNVSNSPSAMAVSGINQGFERLAENTQNIIDPHSGRQLESLVDNTLAEKQVQASAKALKTYDEMIGSLIDVIA
ncbi:MAG: hypothetical protein R3189_08220 [Thiomicrorhabdus chilensis]|uniref:hypothetical protein n=1 Tax=Thiomicrorhabdus chilensis TaxID=63656 RepID=UPI00299F497F|nr:hypothetical protein [Thiomicrorhabdus chilensis]MDX1348215.1 hypothetical protein [Thiomicrorhabdus chilensis]